MDPPSQRFCVGSRWYACVANLWLDPGCRRAPGRAGGVQRGAQPLLQARWCGAPASPAACSFRTCSVSAQCPWPSAAAHAGCCTICTLTWLPRSIEPATVGGPCDGQTENRTPAAGGAKYRCGCNQLQKQVHDGAFQEFDSCRSCHTKAGHSVAVVETMYAPPFHLSHAMPKIAAFKPHSA